MSTTTPAEITRLASITASERAAEINAPTRAWLAEDARRGAGLLVEDADFWAKSGIATGLDLERDRLASAFSDTYKDLHGIRPRWIDFSALTLPELEAKLESLIESNRAGVAHR